MKIGELADLAACSVETIRYYEKERLIPEPSRSEGNYRMYRSEDVLRLSLIRQCRGLGMSLEEIKAVLSVVDSSVDNCAAVNRVLDKHLDHVSVRIAELQVLEQKLKSLRAKCVNESAVADCGIIQDLCNRAQTAGPLSTRSSIEFEVHNT